MAGITDFIGPIYKGLDTFNRESIGFIPSVNLDADIARASLDQEVDSPVATAGDPVELQEASWNAFSPTDDGEVDTVKVKMEHQKVIRIELKGDQSRGLLNSGNYNTILEGKMQSAFKKLANELESYVAKKAIEEASRAVGTAGTVPFSTAGDLSDFANIAKVLDDNGAPHEDRNIVLSSAAMAALRGKQTILLKTNEAGTDEFLRTGYTTPVLGFKIWNSAGLKSHAAKITGDVTITGSPKAGTIELDCADAKSAEAGDIIKIDNENYVVHGVSGGKIIIGKPGLISDAGASITGSAITSAYLPSVAFHKNAIVLATRQLSDPVGGDGCNDQYELTDPLSGITFDVRLYRMYHKSWIEIGIAYGAKVVKSDNVALLLG